MSHAIIFGALKKPLAFAAAIHQINEKMDTLDDLDNYVNMASTIPLKKQIIEMGVNCEDEIGISRLACYCAHEHPFPLEVAEYHTMYLRDMRTQGSIWMAGLERNNKPILFEHQSVVVALAKWFNGRQSFWMQKFHRNKDEFHEPPEESIQVDANMDFDTLIKKMRHAP